MIDRFNTPWLPASHPELTWREGVPCASSYDDIYYSVDDGAAESRYVFLEGSDVVNHLTRESLVVAETGFGTGLNFLLLLQAWCEASASRTAHARLHYIGLEAQPLDQAQLRKALEKWPTLAPVAHRLLLDWPGPVRGCHRLHWPEHNVILDLWWEDAIDALEDLASRSRRLVDFWFLDGFAPSRDERLWGDPLFSVMAAISRPKARFATFTAAGNVRRGLEKAGFEVYKRPGFGRKREALHGQLRDPSGRPPAPTPTTPWDLTPDIVQPQKVLVLGAGLAGSFAARAFAERGIPVTVLDKSQVAGGGSSNLQGLTYTRPSRRHSPLADFAITSFLFSGRLYARLLDSGLKEGIDGGQSGYLQTTDDQQTLDYLEQFSSSNLPFKVLTPDAASEQLGAPLGQSALFFPQAFWLNPEAVCQERLRHDLIEVRENQGQCTIDRHPGHWRITTGSGDTYDSDVLILCTAHSLLEMPETNWLPLQPIRGQTTHMPATTASTALQTAFCHEGYLPPPRLGVHCLGASYGPNDTGLDERAEEHVTNLAKLNAALPDLGFSSSDELRGHVALRCSTADYLPIAGPVPNKSAFNHCYAEWRTRKTRVIDAPCPVLPGLYALSGLGSRGLTAGPLAAEMIVSDALGEASPVPRQLQRALSPARFLRRAIIRGAPL